MLKELYIKNLAVISEAVIPFTDSFNVFTGETGAGKSILINGINAVLGQRVSKDMVRSGCDKAVITALFSGLSENAKKKLDELGISRENDEISLTREIMADGGSVARVNSRTSTVSVLKEIGGLLVNIHGQHDNGILLSPEKHLGIIDDFGELGGLLSDYRETFVKLQETSRRLKRLVFEEKERAGKAESLKRAASEIGKADPKENEDELLAAEYKKAIGAYDISRALESSYTALSGDEDSDGITEGIARLTETLSPFSDMSDALPALIERLENVRVELEDISSELLRESEVFDYDPERIADISARIDLLQDLKKKYGPMLSDVTEKYRSSKKELEKLESSADEIRETAAEKERLLALVSEKAKTLSAARKKTGELFASRIEKELTFLDMPNVKLFVSQTAGKLTGTGMDTVEFLISANKGEDMKPLAKIASGGELSRIMLALKNVIAGKDDIHTLIFDEIDTGVSGRAAQKIGVKLKEAARQRQVLCVTHLARIAAMADNHLLIEKKTEDKRTYTYVRTLDKTERIYEIARITVGDSITDTALKNAEEMLLAAE